MYILANISFFLFSCDSNLITSSVYEKEPVENQCDISIVATTPYPDAIDVYYRAPISITFSQEDSTSTITITQNGNVIAGDVIHDAQSIHFYPQTPLTPSSKYDLEIEYCGSAEPVSFSFTTSDLGLPINGGVSALENRSYMTDLSLGKVIKPLGIGDFLQTLLENTFLISVQDKQNQELFVRMALSNANSNEQNYCVATLEDFPIVDLSAEPFFTLSGSYIPIIIEEYHLNIYDFETYGTVNQDGSTFSHMQAKGLLDLREIFPILQNFNIQANSVNEFITYLSELDVEITTCSDGTSNCMELVVRDLEATEIDQIIMPVCESNCHELCETNFETCINPQYENDACTQ